MPWLESRMWLSPKTLPLPSSKKVPIRLCRTAMPKSKMAINSKTTQRRADLLDLIQNDVKDELHLPVAATAAIELKLQSGVADRMALERFATHVDFVCQTAERR